MLRQVRRLAIWMMLLMGATVVFARGVQARQEKKDYLTDAEGDRIRDAVTPPERMKLFVIFADDRLKKFQYELTRTVPEAIEGTQDALADVDKALKELNTAPVRRKPS